jgi:hypothetical protein
MHVDMRVWAIRLGVPLPDLTAPRAKARQVIDYADLLTT